jgi:hypothetical protein
VRRRLLATSLGEPRRRRLGLRAKHGALDLYLSLTLPHSRRITTVPYGIGAIGRDGRSLAVLHARSGAEVDAVSAYGGNEAEELVLAQVRRWARLGRPTESDLRVTVRYEGDRPRLHIRWPRAL